MTSPARFPDAIWLAAVIFSAFALATLGGFKGFAAKAKTLRGHTAVKIVDSARVGFRSRQVHILAVRNGAIRPRITLVNLCAARDRASNDISGTCPVPVVNFE
jgi:hypothetical protein